MYKKYEKLLDYLIVTSNLSISNIKKYI